ncbi:MAG TPA: hypothetical protein VGG72_03795 [Bryobacteraceae bacterium]|jgi:hypothetical protein
MKKQTIPPEIQGRMAGFRDSAVDMASQAGLYGVEDRFPEIVEPQVRGAAWDFFGLPPFDREVLERRLAEVSQRREGAERRVADFFAAVRGTSFAVNPARPMFGWRACLIVVMTAILIGLVWPSVDLRGCAVLALSAAIAVLALPLLPVTVKFTVAVGRAVVAFVRDLLVATLAYRECRELRRSVWLSEDHRSRVDRWVGEQMAHLVAEYEYNKSLAVTAKLAL